jgi:predicted transport protein
MTDRATQSATQLRNIEEATGMGVADFAEKIDEAGLEKHGAMVSFLKTDLGLTHGNANLIAHLVREARAGGPASESELLDAQYSGGKAHLKDAFDQLSKIAMGLGDDVERVILKTGVSFRRRKQFALVEAPSSKRVQLGLNLEATPDDPRVKETKRMCTHRMDLTDPSEIDSSVTSILEEAYRRAG